MSPRCFRISLNDSRASSRSAQAQLTRERDRVRLLLEVNNAVVSHLNLDDLFPAVSACLRRVVQHDGSALVLFDDETRRFRVHVLHFAKNESFIEEGFGSSRSRQAAWPAPLHPGIPHQETGHRQIPVPQGKSHLTCHT